MNYYYTDPSTGVNEVLGPIPPEVIGAIYTGGVISKNALVCPEGSEEWVSLFDPSLPVVRPRVPVVAQQLPIRNGTVKVELAGFLLIILGVVVGFWFGFTFPLVGVAGVLLVGLGFIVIAAAQVRRTW